MNLLVKMRELQELRKLQDFVQPNSQQLSAEGCFAAAMPGGWPVIYFGLV